MGHGTSFTWLSVTGPTGYRRRSSVHFRAMLMGKKGHIAGPGRRMASSRVSLNII